MPKVDESLPAADRDWSRHDLNGDGFTGGTQGTQFDLDRSTSTRAGARVLDLHSTVQVEERTREFDETALLTDEDLLCYTAIPGSTPAATRRVGPCSTTAASARTS